MALKQSYTEARSGVLRTQEAGRTLLKLGPVNLPQGCIPGTTEALVILDPAQAQPRVVVKDKPKTPRGIDPRNVNPETVGGEGWYGFSYRVPWDETRHTAEQFIESALARFAKNE